MATDRERLPRNVSASSPRSHRGPLSAAVDGSGTRRSMSCPTTAARRRGCSPEPGWTDSDGDGIRDKGGRPARLPTAPPDDERPSAARRAPLAGAVPPRRRRGSPRTKSTSVLFNERARAGRFDALLNVWEHRPDAVVGFPQTWTPAGFGRSNYGRYDNPDVDRLVDRAVASAANRDQRDAPGGRPSRR